MPKKFSQRAEDLRRALAQEAARIMAEHGIEDFLQAKRKAADRLGVNDVAVLPKNVEIEEALRAACEAALPRPKRPAAFRLVAELPLGATGKVARNRLRELAAAYRSPEPGAAA